MNRYIHSSLAPMWLPIVAPVTGADAKWLTDLPADFHAGDLMLLPLSLADQATRFEPAKVLLLPDTPRGPALAEVLEALQPNLERIAEPTLKQGWQQLVEELDSEEDLERCKRFAHSLWHRKRRAADERWLELAELCWAFEYQHIRLPEGEVALYKALGFETWYHFCSDFLEVAPPLASNLKSVWQTYRVKLGWPLEEMLRIGRSKLGLATSRIQTLLEDPEQRDDEKLQELIESVKVDSYAALHDRLKADRDGGHTVSFKLEEIEDPGLVRNWLKEKIQPDLLHGQVFYDNAPLTGEDSSFVIVLNPDIDPEAAAAIKDKLGRMLHWQAIEK